MKDILDALDLEKAVIIGNSLGGWMALKFATTFPERVSGLILIASAGLAEVRPQFLLNMEQTRQADGTMPMTSEIIGEHTIPKEILDFMKSAQKLSRVVPSAEIRLLANCGHVVSNSIEYIIPFLMKI